MSKRIALLIDKDWASYLAHFLEERGHHVHLLSDPQQILKFVKEEGELHAGDFDVVIVHAGFNIRTGEGWFDGANLCEKIREENPLVRIGVTGDLPSYYSEKEFKRAGADFYCEYIGLTSRWMREQIEKGLKTPQEIEMGEENFSTIPEREIVKRWDEEPNEGREGDIYDNWRYDEGTERGA